MVLNPHGHHHLHKRIRMYQHYQPYPHPNPWVRFVDRLMVVMVTVALVMTLPQVLLIWTAKTAAGLSLASWVTYVFSNTLWMVYGVVHHASMLSISSLLFVIMQIFIVTVIIFYG